MSAIVEKSMQIVPKKRGRKKTKNVEQEDNTIQLKITKTKDTKSKETKSKETKPKETKPKETKTKDTKTRKPRELKKKNQDNSESINKLKKLDKLNKISKTHPILNTGSRDTTFDNLTLKELFDDETPIGKIPSTIDKEIVDRFGNIKTFKNIENMNMEQLCQLNTLSLNNTVNTFFSVNFPDGTSIVLITSTDKNFKPILKHKDINGNVVSEERINDLEAIIPSNSGITNVSEKGLNYLKSIGNVEVDENGMYYLNDGLNSKCPIYRSCDMVPNFKMSRMKRQLSEEKYEQIVNDVIMANIDRINTISEDTDSFDEENSSENVEETKPKKRGRKKKVDKSNSSKSNSTKSNSTKHNKPNIDPNHEEEIQINSSLDEIKENIINTYKSELENETIGPDANYLRTKSNNPMTKPPEHLKHLSQEELEVIFENEKCLEDDILDVVTYNEDGTRSYQCGRCYTVIDNYGKFIKHKRICNEIEEYRWILKRINKELDLERKGISEDPKMNRMITIPFKKLNNFLVHMSIQLFLRFIMKDIKLD